MNDLIVVEFQFDKNGKVIARNIQSYKEPISRPLVLSQTTGNKFKTRSALKEYFGSFGKFSDSPKKKKSLKEIPDALKEDKDLRTGLPQEKDFN